MKCVLQWHLIGSNRSPLGPGGDKLVDPESDA